MKILNIFLLMACVLSYTLTANANHSTGNETLPPPELNLYELVTFDDISPSFTDYIITGLNTEGGSGKIALRTGPFSQWGINVSGPRFGSKYLLVDGSADNSNLFYKRTVKFSYNPLISLIRGNGRIERILSFYIDANAHTYIQLIVNGQPVGAPQSPPSGSGWKEMFFIFEASNDAVVGLKTTSTSSQGNDFVIDGLVIRTDIICQ